MRKIAILLAMVAMLGVAAGCGNKPVASPPDNGNEVDAAMSSGAQGTELQEVQQSGSGTDETSAANADAPEAEVEKLTIQVYYTDDDLMDLKPKSREIEFTADRSKYESAFEALQTADDGLLSLWEMVVLNTVKFDETSGQLNLDISLPDEARLGAGGESLALEALKNTMFQFDEVKQIELTLDGAQVDSLMGHVDLEHPMSR
ncbi:GerMN domain-containing protein [Paenibacillus sp. DXFW5]|uniref:GerMN domain-containing protein n=1 Tax=Paenibacillus rhizolycopersici TaxID=2780073 RepID=A0ABS2H1W8_9BACL|nr:GerMN domain-containing protein [Paenibacillus rhizolycopersici]MBM6995417.1 GerMN domain-containing protein [Paenibacillus rhizolycopersici]